MNPLALAVLASAALAGFYENAPVLELSPSNFDSVVLTNDTSIVEFYAPWCGHCRNLQPEYVKAARHLQDIAVVAAVNCDEAKNKPLCSRYRVEGFPTLVVFRPPKVNFEKPHTAKKYAHATEVYSGPRKAKQIVDFVTDRMKNYTKRFATLAKLEEWAQRDTGRVKAVVLTQKDRLTPFLKSLAIDFLGHVEFAYVHVDKDKTEIYSKFGLPESHSSPTLAVYQDGEWLKHDGELSKEAITELFGQYTDVDSVVSQRLHKKSVMEGEAPKKGRKGKSSSSKKKQRDEL